MKHNPVLLLLLSSCLLAQNPTIISTYPSQNAQNVPLDAAITVTFDMAIDPITINTNTFIVRGGYTGRLSGSYSYDDGSRIATFRSNRPFKIGEHVSVTLTTEIAISAGDGLSRPWVQKFTAMVSGGGEFTEVITSNLGISELSAAPLVGDYDLDGDLDLVLLSRDTIFVLKNDGLGNFNRHQFLDMGELGVNTATSLTQGDWDLDGDLDLAVSDFLPPAVRLIFNNGAGDFSDAGVASYDTFALDLGIGDLNGDGKPDMVIAGHDGLSTVFNKFLSSGSQQLETPDENINSVAVSDIDGDGDLDILAAANRVRQVLGFKNDGLGEFGFPSSIGTGPGPSAIEVADWDGDGDVDLVVVGDSSDGIQIFLNDGAGGFELLQTIGMAGGKVSLASGDLNGDGYIDLLASSSDSVGYYLNDGSGSFLWGGRFDLGSGEARKWMSTGDWDNDGSLDVVVAYSDDNNFILYFNRVTFFVRITLDSREEQSDTITINYNISQPENHPINLIAEYATNDNLEWQPASVTGKTWGLDSLDFQGKLFWNSETDLPGLDLPGVRLKITALDTTANPPDTERSFVTAPFHLDNNHEPIAMLVPVDGEYTGNVTLEYLLVDDESDTLHWEAQYSENQGATWRTATVSGLSSGLVPSTYAGSLDWDTISDLPGWEDSLTYFRLVPSDYEVGVPGTVVLHVDNNEPPSATFGTFLSDTIISRASISYTLADAENDTLSIQTGYSLDQGSSWISSFVTIASRSIPPSNYTGSVEWVAFPSLIGTTSDVMLRLLPADYDAGPGDTLTGLTVIYYPGDYSGDLLISTDDLLEFAVAWNAVPQNVAYEIGPAIGMVPDLVPEPDGILDFEDLVVFVQMWNWSFSNNGFAKSVAVLPKSATIKPSLRLVHEVPFNLWEWDGRTVIRLEGKVPDDLMMIDGLISVDGSQIHIKQFIEGGRLADRWQSVPLFVQSSGDSSHTIVALTGLGIRGDIPDGNEEPLLTFEADLIGGGSQTIAFDYTLWDTEGEAIESGSVSLIVENLLPTQYVLHQNYPNPFNPTTTIRYELPRASKVQLHIYNLLGQEVIRLFDEDQTPGYHKAVWSGRDARGLSVSSGIYIARLVAPGNAKSMKMVLLK